MQIISPRLPRSTDTFRFLCFVIFLLFSIKVFVSNDDFSLSFNSQTLGYRAPFPPTPCDNASIIKKLSGIGNNIAIFSHFLAIFEIRTEGAG